MSLWADWLIGLIKTFIKTPIIGGFVIRLFPGIFLILFLILVTVTPQVSLGQAPANSNVQNIPLSKHIQNFILETSNPDINILVKLAKAHGVDPITMTFVNSATNVTSRNVFYDVTLGQGNREIYRASQQAGKPLLAQNGEASIPPQNLAVGSYDVNVYLYGANGVAFPRVETAYFSYQVVIVAY